MRRRLPASASGDVGGLQELVRRYQASALEAAYAVTGDWRASEDIVAEPFFAAYRAVGRFDSPLALCALAAHDRDPAGDRSGPAPQSSTVGGCAV